MSPSIQIRRVTGPNILPFIDDAAALRIEVFREFPYLYDGTTEYEAEYSKSYADTDSGVFVLALSGKRVVGVSTGIAMEDAAEEFRQPFEEQNIDLKQVFYFGESVLRADYRGQGIGNAFFDEREAHAGDLGRGVCTFCGVIRSSDHPLCPIGYRPLEPFWEKRGYHKLPGMTCRFDWKCVNSSEKTSHELQFWANNQLPKIR